MRFTDQVTIVTGGAKGIGKAVVKAFVKEDAFVIILDIDETGASATVGEMMDGRADFIKVDLTKYQQVKDAVDRIAREHGRIDILVNNAGGSESIPFLEANETIWRKVLDLNLMGTIFTCHAVLPHMVRQKFGRIVNTASTAGRQARPFGLAYGAAKAGVISITRSLAVAMAEHDIKVNCIVPGTINTPALDLLRPESVSEALERTALKRRGEPEEVANAVLYLASEEASYTTGHALGVDGGNAFI